MNISHLIVRILPALTLTAAFCPPILAQKAVIVRLREDNTVSKTH